VNAEFDWWLLFVGIAVGAGLVWFVLAESRRHQEEIDTDELPRQAAWLSAALGDDGWTVPPEATGRLLELQREYLAAPPPDPPEAAATSIAPAAGSLPAEAAGSVRPDASAGPAGQMAPAITGSAAGTEVPTSVSETPNEVPGSASATEGAGPTQ